MAGAVLVLQAFSTQRGPARSGAQQKAAGTLVGSRPDLVADALKAKHRVINIKRQHGQPVHAVAGGGGCPARHGAGLGNAFFEDLPVQRFAVTEHRANVFRCVTLADAGVDTNLLEQVGHAKGAGFIGDDRHYFWA